MYSVVLTVHSWLRWITLVMAAGAILSTVRQAVDTAPAPGRRWWDTGFMLAIDLQVLFGLLLYFGLSPFTRDAMADLGAAMANPLLRFWAVEHAGGMFVAVILVRAGRVLSANAPSPRAARSRRLICFSLATALMIAAIPWPGIANGRPLFRW